MLLIGLAATPQRESLTYLPASFANDPPVLGLAAHSELCDCSPPSPLPSPAPAVVAAIQNFLKTGNALPALAQLKTPPLSASSLNRSLSPDIHSIGANAAGLFDAYVPDGNAVNELQRQYISSAYSSAFDSSIQQSLTQQPFLLSSVFDGTSASDAALFNFDTDSDDEQDGGNDDDTHKGFDESEKHVPRRTGRHQQFSAPRGASATKFVTPLALTRTFGLLSIRRMCRIFRP
jgi:hypothetical protein